MSIKVLSTVASGGKPIQSKDLQAAGFGLDFQHWLPFAAKSYDLSPDPKDYLLYPVPILYSDLPNRNGIAMPLADLLAWNRDRGCQAYMTWKGMPMFAEHQSDKAANLSPDKEAQVLKSALGVIADVSLRRINGFGGGQFWKVMALAALDRTKGADYVKKVEQGKINSYSMGAMVNSWSCSMCGAGEGECRHIDPKKPVVFYEMNGSLVYKNVHGISGYELSIVADPAYPTAFSDIQLKF